MFQSTRPYGARRFVAQFWLPFVVSIHAPVWGATPNNARLPPGRLVSIHAPVWGATYFPVFIKFHLVFQSTRPYGARPFSVFRYCSRDVSIHAPVWGATECNGDYWHNRPVSIHAPVWGATDDVTVFDQTNMFQSTRPYGARQIGHVIFDVFHFGFNPRARMGRDIRVPKVRRLSDVSIHAPVWGATQGKVKGIYGQYVSIHAPVWGATSAHGKTWADFVFQSTRPYGARQRN